MIWLKKIKDNKFVLLDSISTLLIYNEPETISKFVHFLTVKMRVLNLSVILIGLNENQGFLAELSQYCDKTIYGAQ